MTSTPVPPSLGLHLSQLRKIQDFADYLALNPISYDEIMKFLVINTFSEQEFFIGYIAELLETGIICSLGSFGMTQEAFDSIPEVPITMKFPLNESIRSKHVVLDLHDSDYYDKYPLLKEIKVEVVWVTSVNLPVLPVGGMGFYSSIAIELTESLLVFFTAISSLLGLYASRLPEKVVKELVKDKVVVNLGGATLTDRQLVIAGFLENGFTNKHIGEEIGFSESLIRQETVAIYRKLNVSGRKAMQAIQILRLESLVETDILKSL
jgi:DNA-binding NarL/FixJ family response regulator